MGSYDKTTFKLSEVLPRRWISKLTDLGRRYQKRRPSTVKVNPGCSEAVTADLGSPFVTKSLSHIRRYDSPIRVFTSVRHGGNGHCSSPVNHTVFDTPHLLTSPGKGMMIRTTTPRKTHCNTPLQLRTPQRKCDSDPSIESGCNYRSTLASLRKRGQGALSSRGSFSAGSFRRAASSAKSWKLLTGGCRTGNRTCHASLDMDKASCVFELDEATGFYSIDKTVPGSSLAKTEENCGEEHSWSVEFNKGEWAETEKQLERERAWSVELSRGALMKNQLALKKRKDDKSKNRKLMSSGWSSPESPYRTAGLQQKLTFSNCVTPRLNSKMPEESATPLHREGIDSIGSSPCRLSVSSSADQCNSEGEVKKWSCCSSFASDDSLFTSSFELGLKKTNKSHWSTTDSSGELDWGFKGNVSFRRDSALMMGSQAAERLRWGSKSFRELRREIIEEGENTPFLDSLDDMFEDRSPGSDWENSTTSRDRGRSFLSQCGSPKTVVYNSPVFEGSYIEATAKPWGIDFTALTRRDDRMFFSGPLEMTSGKSAREFHSVGAHSSYRTKRYARETFDSDSRRDARRTERLRDREASASKARRRLSSDLQEGSSSPPRRWPSERETIVEPVQDTPTTARKEVGCGRRKEDRKPRRLVSMPDELNGVVKESVAVVKRSCDPYNDFRESMLEMIVEKDIEESDDLEELLQCYLSLNEVEYHTLIVDVFTDVWLELFEST